MIISRMSFGFESFFRIRFTDLRQEIPNEKVDDCGAPAYTSSLVPFKAPLIPVSCIAAGTKVAGHSSHG
jgi:hypothetical protein